MEEGGELGNKSHLSTEIISGPRTTVVRFFFSLFLCSPSYPPYLSLPTPLSFLHCPYTFQRTKLFGDK